MREIIISDILPAEESRGIRQVGYGGEDVEQKPEFPALPATPAVPNQRNPSDHIHTSRGSAFFFFLSSLNLRSFVVLLSSPSFLPSFLCLLLPSVFFLFPSSTGVPLSFFFSMGFSLFHQNAPILISINALSPPSPPHVFSNRAMVTPFRGFSPSST